MGHTVTLKQTCVPSLYYTQDKLGRTQALINAPTYTKPPLCCSTLPHSLNVLCLTNAEDNLCICSVFDSVRHQNENQFNKQLLSYIQWACHATTLRTCLSVDFAGQKFGSTQTWASLNVR